MTSEIIALQCENFALNQLVKLSHRWARLRSSECCRSATPMSKVSDLTGVVFRHLEEAASRARQRVESVMPRGRQLRSAALTCAGK